MQQFEVQIVQSKKEFNTLKLAIAKLINYYVLFIAMYKYDIFKTPYINLTKVKDD